MHIAVTGASGLLGQKLLGALLKKGCVADQTGSLRTITRITAFDMTTAFVTADKRVEHVTGNIADPEAVAQLLPDGINGVFHLAAVVSSQAEAEFDLGMRVNVDASRLIMERLRAVAPAARLITTSSVAVFGGKLPDVVGDDHVWEPKSSYGTQKAIADLLLSDYSRKGFLDGRTLRMPTIVVRPGKPNRAASSFASSIIREPLAGVEVLCPVEEDTTLWLMSPELAVRNLIHAYDLPATSFEGRYVVNMPGISVQVGEMLAVLEDVGGAAARALVRMEPETAIQRIVNSWPKAFATKQANDLGFMADDNFRCIVEAFLRTH